ncbi:hypothetical protein J3L18_05445 [Mucilaginibacter gossypii]|uniref:hypothetical protein n=1 Tax=Mucilaginibacter gossypii TaxID=551996 RepID=UPI000DCCB906|nr:MULTISPECIES: hypothetical protein [Mucilaginibacter]QTE38523.1 hypothetical protein J3L18_05445 [Mucilaginibacter gossypii]RAV55741.1 hypothetical protein DIU36_16755 [Mucilaginibacter rubeus]
MSAPLLNYINLNKQDAVVYKAKTLYVAAGEDIHLQTEAVSSIKLMLACIDDDILADFYIKRISQEIGTAKNALAKGVKSVQDTERRKNEEQHVAEGKQAFPAWVNKDRANTIGFDWKVDTVNPDYTGIYFRENNNYMRRLTNFTIKPILQVISHKDDGRRRLTEISNGYTKQVFELPSSAFTSTVKFETMLMDFGVYFCEEGFTQSHLNRIKSFFLGQYSRGYELTTLGWQDEGFFAFSNALFKDGVKYYNEYGIAEVDGTKYLSMGSSNILEGLRAGTDRYKNDRHLKYIMPSVSFRDWCDLMMKVYGNRAMMGIAWAFLAPNRDIVLSRSNYCPLPYCYGSAGSGKSKFVESIIAIFLHDIKLINLNQVSIFAFWASASRFKNVPMGYNEFDPQAIAEAITKAFKGMAENEGRQKGTGKGNDTETQEVNCMPMLLGQYAATVDDGSIMSRSIAERFVENNDYTDEESDNFDKLKAYEKAGITGLSTVIIQERPMIEDNYLTTFKGVMSALNADFKEEGYTPKTRVVENYTVVLTLMKLYQGAIDLPFTYDDFYAYCKDQIRNLNTVIAESNTLGEFWKVVESLSDRVDGHCLEPGWDYKIETVTELKGVLAEGASKKVISFDKPTRLLFLRFTNVYPAYAKEKRNVTGKVAINESTVKAYLTEQKHFIGTSAGSIFKSKKTGLKKNTSSMVFNYEKLLLNDVNLMESAGEDDRVLVTLDGHVERDAYIQHLLNTEKVVFMLTKDESYQRDNVRVEKITKTKCFWTDLSQANNLKLGDEIRVTGMLSIQGEKQWRNLEVQGIEVIRQVPREVTPAAPANPYAPPSPVNTQLSFESIDPPGDDDNQTDLF